MENCLLARALCSVFQTSLGAGLLDGSPGAIFNSPTSVAITLANHNGEQNVFDNVF